MRPAWMHLPSLAGAVLAATVLLGACGDDAKPADFAAQAQRLIALTGHDRPVIFVDPECVAPPDTHVGTTFDCITSDTFATKYRFKATITGKGTFDLRGEPRP